MEDFLLLVFNPANQIYQILVAAFLGVFLGIQKEMILQKEGGQGFMGIRTITLFVVLGTVSTFFSAFTYLPILFFLGIFAFLLVAYFNGVFNLKKIGLTSEVSALLMFWVGVLVGYEEIILAIVLTVLVSLSSAYKKYIHSFAKGFSLREWSGSLQLLVISALVLPVLPKNPIDPYGILVPFDVWLLVILISGIGFFGYFFNKYFGKRKSVLLTSSMGALASSTAVTTSLAGLSKKTDGNSDNLFASGLMFATFVMHVRVMLAILIVSSVFVFDFILPSLVMAFVSFLFFVYFFYRDRKMEKLGIVKENTKLELHMKSPFDILPALKFAILFILILFVIYFGKKFMGDGGAYVASFFASFADADAVILSVLESVNKANAEAEFATVVIAIAVVGNTMVKALYTYMLGSRAYFMKIFLPIFIISFMGLLAAVLF